MKTVEKALPTPCHLPRPPRGNLGENLGFQAKVERGREARAWVRKKSLMSVVSIGLAVLLPWQSMD